MTDAPLAQIYRLNLAKRVWEMGGSSLEPPPSLASSRTRIRFAAGDLKVVARVGLLIAVQCLDYLLRIFHMKSILR
jgi:hypothetical protein